jgi:hypothetical protein
MTHPSDPQRRDPHPDRESVDSPPPPSERAVDESVEESFPASDPPSWEPLHTGTPDPSPASPATPSPDGGSERDRASDGDPGARESI